MHFKRSGMQKNDLFSENIMQHYLAEMFYFWSEERKIINREFTEVEQRDFSRLIHNFIFILSDFLFLKLSLYNIRLHETYNNNCITLVDLIFAVPKFRRT